MEIKDRIKIIRKEKKLTQVEFGDIIGVKGNTVTNYETGLRNPTDAVIKSICREFNVNEKWLRTGEGDMFNELDREQEIASMTAMLFKEEESSFKYRMIKALCGLDEQGWEVLEKLAKEITEDKKD